MFEISQFFVAVLQSNSVGFWFRIPINKDSFISYDYIFQLKYIHILKFKEFEIEHFTLIACLKLIIYSNQRQNHFYASCL